jgi:hypothetical protein
MPFRPAEVHPEEHLGPVGRLRATGTGADREDRALLVVLAREQERGSLPAEVRLEGRRLAIELGAQVGIAGLLDQLEGRQEIVGPRFEASPQLDLGAEVACLAKDLLGGALVVPEAGLAGQRLQVGDATLLGPEVKAAPTSTGSARSGRGSWRRPSVPGLEVLKQDRAELDQAECRFAPGDDGVHAGAVAVVGAHTAIAITVEGCGVTAGSTISLAGDEIDE